MVKVLIINITVFFICCININPAYAENNSFVPGTLILTPDGNVPIEELHSGNRVVGYNFETHKDEIYHVENIEQDLSFSYYSINNKAKFAGTNYVYVKTSGDPKIKRVQQLKVNDRLSAQNHQDYKLEKIEQIVKPLTLYQIILEEKNRSIFADHFLVYSGTKIPNRFKANYIYINCGSGTLVYGMFDSRYCPQINAKILPGIALGLLILVVASLIIFKVFDWIEKNNSKPN